MKEVVVDVVLEVVVREGNFDTGDCNGVVATCVWCVYGGHVEIEEELVVRLGSWGV